MNKLKEINGKYYQECQAYLLPIKGLNRNRGVIFKDSIEPFELVNNISPTHYEYSDCEYYHLYIVSDEGIKSGELCLVDTTGTIERAENNLSFKEDYCLKIIATTDSSLVIEDECSGNCQQYNFPQPSKQFIQKYIDKYNKGHKIEKVLVEYDAKAQVLADQHIPIQNIKVDSHNYITIKPIKDSWTREEVMSLCENAYDSGRYTIINQEDFHTSNFDTWVEENL